MTDDEKKMAAEKFGSVTNVANGGGSAGKIEAYVHVEAGGRHDGHKLIGFMTPPVGIFPAMALLQTIDDAERLVRQLANCIADAKGSGTPFPEIGWQVRTMKPKPATAPPGQTFGTTGGFDVVVTG